MTVPADIRPEPSAGDPQRNRANVAGRLAARYGRRTVLILLVIVIAGFFGRAWFALNPDARPGDDALAYRALAESLYRYGSYGGPEFRNPSDWSPGAPLIYAGSWYLTGGVRDGVARGVEALFGTGTIILAFLLTAALTGPVSRRGPPQTGSPNVREITASPGPPEPPAPLPGRFTAPLVAAFLVAFYPPFLAAPGTLMSEPPAEFTLPAAILAFLWADRHDRLAAWLLPGMLFGLTALIRPEYLLIAVLFGIFLLIRAALPDRRGKRGRMLLATLLFGLAALAPIVPWSVHNYVKLDRVVPLSTGSGKALFTGTYRPGDGDYQRVKAALLEEQTGRHLEPGSAALDRIDPVPLFDRVAARYPGLDRDAALGRIGRENLRRYLAEDPLGYIGMTARKVWRMWSTASGGVAGSGIGALIHLLLVAAGLAGLFLLALRRRLESIVMAMPIVGITVVASLTLAPPRRNEILMTLVLPLASLSFTALGARVRRRERRPAAVTPHPEKEPAT